MAQQQTETKRKIERKNREEELLHKVLEEKERRK
jgi:hypothetical protein